MRLKPMVGHKFSKLTVVKRGENCREGKPQYVCVCDCGNETLVRGKLLRSNHTTSCGCHGRQQRIASRVRHGKSTTPTYKIWRGMLDRCHNQNSPNYPSYGGKGISVCDKWRKNFLAFLADMGERPSQSHTIDRKDWSLGYSPDNCKWATRTEQANNKSNNRLLDFNGKSQSVAMWARELGISRGLIASRLDRGLPVDRALSQTGRSVLVLEFNGQTKPLVQWCRELNINSLTVRHRLKNGWSIPAALTTQVR